MKSRILIALSEYQYCGFGYPDEFFERDGQFLKKEYRVGDSGQIVVWQRIGGFEEVAFVFGGEAEKGEHWIECDVQNGVKVGVRFAPGTAEPTSPFLLQDGRVKQPFVFQQKVQVEIDTLEETVAVEVEIGSRRILRQALQALHSEPVDGAILGCDEETIERVRTEASAIPVSAGTWIAVTHPREPLSGVMRLDRRVSKTPGVFEATFFFERECALFEMGERIFRRTKWKGSPRATEWQTTERAIGVVVEGGALRARAGEQENKQ